MIFLLKSFLYYLMATFQILGVVLTGLLSIPVVWLFILGTIILYLIGKIVTAIKKLKKIRIRSRVKKFYSASNFNFFYLFHRSKNATNQL